MKKLFLKMENGNVPIAEDQIEKYNLKAGSISPNNGYNVVDKNGEYKLEPTKDKNKTDHSIEEIMTDGVILTTSELIDLSQGADSEDTGDLMPE